MADSVVQTSRLPGSTQILITRRGWSSYLIPIGLVLVFLVVVFGLPVHTPLQPASWLTFIALVITPGYLLGEIVTWRLNLDWLERLALALPLGVSVLAIPGMVTLLAYKTIYDLAFGWILIVAMLIIVWLLHGLWLRRNLAYSSARWAWDEIVMLLLLAAAFVYMFPTLSLYKMDGDAFTAIAFTSDALTGAPMNVTEPLLGSGKGPGVRATFNQMLVLFDLWSYLSKADYIELTATASRSMFALWAILAYYMLGKAAGNGSRRFGLFVVSIQLLVFLAAPFFRSDNVSIFFFERINADKFTVTVTMLPVVFALALRYLRHGRRDVWVAAAIAVFAVSAIHPLIAAMLALALAAFGGLHLFLNLRGRQAWGRVIGLAILVLIVMGLPLVQLVIAHSSDPLAPSYPASFEGWSVGDRYVPVSPFLLMRNIDVYGPLPSLAHLEAEQANTDASPFLIWRYAVNMRRHRLVLFDVDHYISDPTLILEPPYLLSLLMLPVLLWGLRAHLAAQFALGTSLATLFVMFNPILTPLIGDMVMPWLLWRFVWLLPYALIFALVAQRLLNRLVITLAHLPILKPVENTLLTSAPLGLLIVCALLLQPNILATIEEMKLRTAGPVVYPTPEKIFTRLATETASTGPVMVLADQNLSVSIPAFVGNADVVGHRLLTTSEIFPADEQDQALQRHIDQYYFFHKPYLTVDSIQILQRYNIRYVVVPSGSDLDIQLRLSPHWFEWLVDDQSYTLYSLRRLPPVTASIRGNTAMVERQWKTAQRYYQLALQQDPSDMLAVLGLAETYRLQGQFDLALTIVQQAAARYESPALHFRLGQLYAENNQPERSLTEFDQAQRGAPQVSRFHIALGDACLRADRLDCASEQYQAAAAAENLPDNSARLIALANLWQQREHTELALTLYELAAAINPNEHTQLLLVSVYQGMELFDRAEALLQTMHQEDPLSANIVSAMARLMVAKDETDQAVNLYRQAIWLQVLQAQDTLYTRLTLAEVLLAADRLDEADDQLEQVLALQPDNAVAHMLLGDLYRAQNRPDLAMAAYNHTLQLDPTEVAAYISLSEQYRQQAIPPDETVALLEMATKENPDQAIPLLSMGDQWRRYGQVEAAITTYHLALDLLESNELSYQSLPQSTGRNRALAYSRLAALYEDTGQVEAAMSYYRAAVAAAPSESWTRVLLADAMRRRNDAPAAEQTYRHIIQVDPTYLDAYVRLADLLSSRGDPTAASELYDRVLQVISSVSDPAQTSRAWLALGDFYGQSRLPDLRSGSGEQDWPVAAVSDPATERALNAYAKALETDETLAAVQMQSRFFQEIGQTDQAIQLFDQRIQQGEQENWSPALLARYYKGLGDVYLSEQQLDPAVNAYRQAANRDSWWPPARLGLAQALSEQGDTATALVEFQQTVALAPGSVQAQVALANAVDREGKAEQALAIYQTVAETYPGNPVANLALARALQERQQWVEAEQSYRHAIAMTPGEAKTYLGLADLYLTQARYEEAEAVLRYALQVDYYQADAYLRLGDLLARLARYSEAVAIYEQALRIEPSNWRFYAGLAQVYQAVGQIDQAIEHLKKAAAADRTVPEPLLQLASLLHEQNRSDQAEEMYWQALERSPGDAMVHQALADFYQSLGLGKEALNQLALAATENPDSMLALVSYGDQLRLWDRGEEARSLYRQAEQVAAPTAAGYRALAAAFQAQGQNLEALAWLDKAIVSTPEQAVNWIQKGELQAQLGDSEAALATLEQATQREMGEGQAWYALGNAYLANDQTHQGLLALEKAVTIAPTFIPAYGSLIETYLAEGNQEKAAATVEAAARAVPGSYLVDLYTASYLEEQQLWEEARRALDQAHLKAPGLPDPFVARGELEQSQGKDEEAVVWFERAVNLRPGDPTANLRLIDALLAFGHNDRALSTVEQALANRPGDFELLVRLGRVQQILGRFDEAELTFLKATDLNQADSRPLAELATLKLAQGRSELAIAAYQQAIALQPDNESYYRALSQVWSTQGQSDQALIVLEDGLAQVPRPISLWVALSNLYLQQGETNLAQQLLDQAIEQVGEDSQLLQALGTYYRSQAQFERAEQIYNRLLALYPDQADGYLTMADLYLQRGRIRDALGHYERALSAEPFNPTVYFALGNIHQRLGNTEKAAPYFIQALTLDPRLENAYLNLATLYQTQARWNEAQQVHEQGLAVAPTSGQLLIQYSNFVRQRGDIERARILLDQAVSFSARADTFIARADLYRVLGQFDPAQRDLLTAIKLEPGSANAWVALGNLYGTRGDPERAKHAYQQAVAVSPHAATGYLSLAGLAYDQGELDEAWPYYEAALKVEPASIAPRLNLAQAHVGQRNWDEAETAYQEALALSPLATEAYVGMADMSWQKSANLAQAVDWLSQATESGVDLAIIYRTLGDIYRRGAQSGLTADYLQRSINLEPGFPDGYLAMSSLYLAEGMPQEAKRYALQAVDVAPRDPSAYISLGNIYQSLGVVYDNQDDLSAAVHNYRLAIEMDATRLDGYQALADLYMARQQYDEAINTYQQASQLNPENWSLWISVGNIYAIMDKEGPGDYQEEAVAAYQQASRLAPLEWSPWIALGNFYVDTNEPDAALSAFERAKTLHPSRPEPWLGLGDTYQLKEDVSAARAAFEQASELRPDQLEPVLRLAGLFEEQEEWAEAERYARQAIAIDPFDSTGYMTLGRILDDASYTLGKWRRILTDVDKANEAAANFWQAAQLDPRQIGAYRSWTRLHIDTGLRHVDMTPLQAALNELANSPDSETMQAQVALGLGYNLLEGPTDRILNHLHQASALDPAFDELYRELAQVYEDRMNGRVALDFWHRYLLAVTARGSDSSIAREHITKLWRARIAQPVDKAEVSGLVEISGVATGDHFQFYILQYTATGLPDGWVTISGPVDQPVEPGLLGTWSTTDLPPGDYKLRLTVVGFGENYGPYDEITVKVRSEN